MVAGVPLAVNKGWLPPVAAEGKGGGIHSRVSS